MIVTIWIALGFFVAGEFEPRTPRRLQPIARSLFLVGALLCAVHLIIAMHMVHAWNHQAAVAATAAQTAQIYGVRWGGGVYVNYLFTTVWLVDALHRVVSPGAASRRPSLVRWSLRAFYLTIIVNAAVIFAPPGRRWLGMVVVAAVLVSTTIDMKEVRSVKVATKT